MATFSPEVTGYIVCAGLLLALMISWTVRAVTDNEKQMRCVESGRRDCVQIAAPPQGMRALR